MARVNADPVKSYIYVRYGFFYIKMASCLKKMEVLTQKEMRQTGLLLKGKILTRQVAGQRESY